MGVEPSLTFGSLTVTQKELLRQVCQNKNAVADDITATILTATEMKSAQKLEALGLIEIDRHLATPTHQALVWFPQWNPDQLTFSLE